MSDISAFSYHEPSIVYGSRTALKCAVHFVNFPTSEISDDAALGNGIESSVCGNAEGSFDSEHRFIKTCGE